MYPLLLAKEWEPWLITLNNWTLADKMSPWLFTFQALAVYLSFEFPICAVRMLLWRNGNLKIKAKWHKWFFFIHWRKRNWEISLKTINSSPLFPTQHWDWSGQGRRWVIACCRCRYVIHFYFPWSQLRLWHSGPRCINLHWWYGSGFIYLLSLALCFCLMECPRALSWAPFDLHVTLHLCNFCGWNTPVYPD